MFTHYVKMDRSVMAMQACHCLAEKNHFPGEERGLLPRAFYQSLFSKEVKVA